MRKAGVRRLPLFSFVRLTGLEPARRETLDPKSSASTNSATGADRRSQFPFKVNWICL